MVDRHHVDGVVDIWSLAELDAALDHADEKIVGIGDYNSYWLTSVHRSRIWQCVLTSGYGITGNVSRSYDRST